MNGFISKCYHFLATKNNLLNSLCACGVCMSVCVCVHVYLCMWMHLTVHARVEVNAGSFPLSFSVLWQGLSWVYSGVVQASWPWVPRICLGCYEHGWPGFTSMSEIQSQVLMLSQRHGTTSPGLFEDCVCTGICMLTCVHLQVGAHVHAHMYVCDVCVCTPSTSDIIPQGHFPLVLWDSLLVLPRPCWLG